MLAYFSIASLLSFLVYLAVQECSIGRLRQDLRAQELRWQTFETDYRAKYIPAEDSFNLHIRRDARSSTLATDLEIIEWAKKKKVRFDFEYLHQTDDGCHDYVDGGLNLYFDKPAVAMEYKLRWHNV